MSIAKSESSKTHAGASSSRKPNSRNVDPGAYVDHMQQASQAPTTSTSYDKAMKRPAEYSTSEQPSKRRRSLVAHDDHRKPLAAASGLGIFGDDKGLQFTKQNVVVNVPKHIVFDEGGSTPVSKRDTGRRKSVTFTPDTKQEDGFSAARIFKSYIPPGRGSQEAGDDKSQEIDESPSKTQAGEKKKKKKKTQKQKKNSKQVQLQQPKDSKPVATKSPNENGTRQRSKDEPLSYLQYLQQYNDNRTNWKFNSTQQKLLLKNAFNIYRIPASSTPALVEYISGLQSNSFRQTLAKEAREIIATFHAAHSGTDAPTLSTMDSDDVRQTAFESCLARQADAVLKEQEDRTRAELQSEKQRAERAGIILWKTLGAGFESGSQDANAHSETATSSHSQTSTKREEARPALKKKRKSRTDVSSDESSSEESSSSSSSSSSDGESESESDSDSEPSPARRAKVQKSGSKLRLGNKSLKKQAPTAESSGEDHDTSSSEESDDKTSSLDTDSD